MNKERLTILWNTGRWETSETVNVYTAEVSMTEQISALMIQVETLEKEYGYLIQDADAKESFIAKLRTEILNMTDTCEQYNAECLCCAAQESLYRILEKIKETEDKKSACLAQLHALQTG